MSIFCHSSPPKSSRCTSCRIQRTQPVIVDRLYMAIFVLNRSSSLTQEFLEGYRHFSLVSWFEQRFPPLTMNSNQMTIFKSLVILVGSLNRADVNSLRFIGIDVVHNSNMLRWRHSLWWYSVRESVAGLRPATFHTNTDYIDCTTCDFLDETVIV